MSDIENRKNEQYWIKKLIRYIMEEDKRSIANKQKLRKTT